MSARRSGTTQGLRHIALKTRDIAATERFYIGVLGFKVAFTHRSMIFLETPGGGDLLNFVKTRETVDPAAGGLDHFGIRVSRQRWKALQAALDRAGVTIEGRRGRSALYVGIPTATPSSSTATDPAD